MKTDFFEFRSPGAADEPRAAVGIIVCSLPIESVLLIKRSEHRLDPWSGHYAFPGGRREEGDATILTTCLREVAEETGIVLGPESLDRACEPALAGRNVKAPILVQPYVFRLDERPQVTIEEREIARYTWLSTDAFRDMARHRVIEVRSAMTRPVYPLDDYFVWGFTYTLLCRLLGMDQRSLAG